MQFSVNDDQTYIRAPIHFSYTANSGSVIYIDNLQIAPENFGKTPVIVEAESGTVGSGFSTLQDEDISYVTTTSNYIGLSGPGDSSRIITYQVTFQDSGNYNLFARARVGSGNWDDDSFFSGRGFGNKNDTASVDWVVINGLAGAGYISPTDVVNEMGTAGSEVWKWINITQNFFPIDSTKGIFYVSTDSLTKTFQIGSREDGLDFDKFAFGKSNLYFTVNALDNVLPGSDTIEPPDSSNYYQGPPLAQDSPKFLGNVMANDNIFANYWNQLTPGNEGKWGSVAGSSDTTRWNWSGLDALYNYSKEHNLIYKHHTLIWGAQQPSWISSLDSAAQYNYIETWIRMVGERYPDIDMVDVVNEPLS
jgi:endo-1,4-beta-xylanase